MTDTVEDEVINWVDEVDEDKDQVEAVKNEVKVSSSGRGIETILDDDDDGFTPLAEAVPIGSEVDRLKVGFVSAVRTTGTGLVVGNGFFLRSSKGLPAGLELADPPAGDDERTWTDKGRCWWPILPATVKRAASASCTRDFHPSWAVSSTLSREAIKFFLLLVLLLLSLSLAWSSSAGAGPVPILLRQSFSPLFCNAANLPKQINNWNSILNKTASLQK